jgi:hypothetical protein
MPDEGERRLAVKAELTVSRYQWYSLINVMKAS